MTPTLHERRRGYVPKVRTAGYALVGRQSDQSSMARNVNESELQVGEYPRWVICDVIHLE